MLVFLLIFENLYVIYYAKGLYFKAFDYNNSFFSHSYQGQGSYQVWINCTGLANYLFLEFDHVVQPQLVGLFLTKPGANTGESYYIEFDLLSGGNVEQLDLYFDGILDTGTTWDDTNLKGLSSFHSGDPYPGIHDILIVMANAVSEVNYHIILNQTSVMFGLSADVYFFFEILNNFNIH